MLNAYRDEVRAAALLEAAADVDVDDDCGCGGCDSCVLRAAAGRLREKAGEKCSRKADATPDQLRAYANEVRRQDAIRLLRERTEHVSRAIFCDGITHAAARLTQWAAEMEKDTSGGSQPHEGESTPDFFQPGRTYAHRAWSFRCDAVTTNPQTGERAALGWLRFDDDAWRLFSATEGAWADGWRDITAPACATGDTEGEAT
jgi:hypothetical protein